MSATHWMTDPQCISATDLREAKQEAASWRASFGQSLRFRREVLGLSMRQFALSIGADPSFYARLESGKGWSARLAANALEAFALRSAVPSTEARDEAE